MVILPAIDMKGGECVRLLRGDYATAHKVAENPVETALRFQGAGAQWLHMVDLDGAKDARMVNRETILEVTRACDLNVEVGGGIRDMEAVRSYLDNGVTRVILGSAALKNPDFVKEAVQAYGERIAVGIDARGGMVAAEGWTDTSSVHYLDLAMQMEQAGVSYIIFTDIDCDGTLSGPNLTQLDALNQKVSCNIIASGGIATLKDIVNLKSLGLYGAICGKSLYSGSLNLAQAIAAGEEA
ncbi:MAG TPA: 1-(5-phosphoribosyl)-5-[(5-phosphoribosylamino)methylideneamino]imidazole-4-carboxamide isomerase [Candidatus Gallacutalibacter stercoravium]|nr:1-(5-phosphoribosyl)-5-[(5-phosphoribosylamino)methylideneamino]imidazole-4-carboxamide isomerase [Candidatus Gallacutalibacter stercoravium]